MKHFLSYIVLVALIFGLVSVPVLAAGQPFVDVSADAWYADAVNYVYSENLMNGVTPDRFEPDRAATRKMVVDVLWRAEGRPDFENHSDYEVQFADESSDSVGWAWTNGIVYGYHIPFEPPYVPTGIFYRFEPDRPVTRQELAAIIYRYARYAGLDHTARQDLSAYADCETVSGWARKSMQWCVANGILVGIRKDGQLVLNPQGTASRAELATILMRLGKLKSTPDEPGPEPC